MGRARTKSGVLAIDPFDVSSRPTPAQRRWAEWFKEMTQGMTEGGTYHIRRIHYRTLGKPKPDGTQYENTVNDAALLNRASEYARYLGLVDFNAIEDHKNEGLIAQVDYDPDDVDIIFRVRSKSLTHAELSGVDDVVETTDASNISYGVSIRQPYHLELWVEKSTANDVLLPICKEFGATLVVASGQFSITNVKDLFIRIRYLNKPIRVFYIRDFDPAGQSMARAVSRKIEWFVRSERPEVDLKVFDICLTPEQCVEYQLPRTPMDRKEKYKGNFEKKFGEGAVELDALEALHPGTLRNIVIDAISPYYDDDLPSDIEDFEDEENERYEQYKETIIQGVISTNRPELEPLVQQYNELISQANEVGGKIQEIINQAPAEYGFYPTYPEFSCVTVDEEPEAILDTRLSYEKQLTIYRNTAKGVG